jgi:DNA-binding transcriptional LysR family regulator
MRACIATGEHGKWQKQGAWAETCFRWTPDDEPWAWELERGKKTWRVPVRDPVIANDRELLHALALGGNGLLYTLDAVIVGHLARRRLCLILEAYAPTIPGLFLYFPSRAHVSPALRAFVAVARRVAGVAAQAGRRSSSF